MSSVRGGRSVDEKPGDTNNLARSFIQRRIKVCTLIFVDTLLFFYFLGESFQSSFGAILLELKVNWLVVLALTIH